ncbi:hypothetical protein T492DRAFT_260774 [Pavlovales sp. CCMP2436]|nr:hypothetical protein T492DRAFT_260774 [Pavlovales sp. CCMP2436]
MAQALREYSDQGTLAEHTDTVPTTEADQTHDNRRLSDWRAMTGRCCFWLVSKCRWAWSRRTDQPPPQSEDHVVIPERQRYRGMITRQPDLVELAVVAERAGVDLRVIAMCRYGGSALQSQQRRKYGTLPELAISTTSSLNLLTAQILTLSPSFVSCVDVMRFHTGTEGMEGFPLFAFLHPLLVTPSRWPERSWPRLR